MSAVSEADCERHGVPVWLCVLLSVRTRLGGEGGTVSCDAGGDANVAAEENPRVMYVVGRSNVILTMDARSYDLI